MGIHNRTARRLIYSLEAEGYLERGHGTHRQRHTYSPTLRLLALAGQLAARLPLLAHGAHAVRQLRQSTGLDAYLVVPSYGDVIVLATAGDHAPGLWTLLPATDSAGGNVLLAYRQSWRDAQRPANNPAAALELETRSAKIRRDGYAVTTQGNVTTLGVPVPMDPAPLAALVLCSHTRVLSDDGRQALLAALHDAAGELHDTQPFTPSQRA